MAIELPFHVITALLNSVARWACLDSSALQDNEDELHASMQQGDARAAITRWLRPCVPASGWRWDAYEAFRSEDGQVFSRDQWQDMVGHVADKLLVEYMALHRKQQMDELMEFRPYRLMKGRCACSESRTHQEAWHCAVARHADDLLWQESEVPWDCAKLYCRCDVYALSEREFSDFLSRQPGALE